MEERKRIWYNLQKNLKSVYPSFTFHYIGQIPEKEVSFHLQNCDFGLSVTQTELLQKSGSVAAMLEHRLPVIVSRISNNCSALHKRIGKAGDSYCLTMNSWKSWV